MSDDVLSMAVEDSGTFQRENATDADRSLVSTLTAEMAGLEDELENLDQLIKQKKSRLRRVTEEELPEALDKVGMSECKMKNGAVLSVAKFCTASLSEGRKEDAISWLLENEHQSIIRTAVTVSFSMGDVEAANEFAEFARGFNRVAVDPQVTRDVNTGTFKSLVRELVDNGAVIPLETLGVYIGRKAKLKRPRQSAESF